MISLGNLDYNFCSYCDQLICEDVEQPLYVLSELKQALDVAFLYKKKRKDFWSDIVLLEHLYSLDFNIWRKRQFHKCVSVYLINFIKKISKSNFLSRLVHLFFTLLLLFTVKKMYNFFIFFRFFYFFFLIL